MLYKAKFFYLNNLVAEVGRQGKTIKRKNIKLPTIFVQFLLIENGIIYNYSK
ncbi:hypothetical protein [Spiroplasma endosymbiont of Sarcophaga carnaria]|uniref:hypothetical protein n=1 Tax=Spiroplasma endosymbiont of Sarcophaga carnaria TaxID=3066303 RepID=UPI0030CE658D